MPLLPEALFRTCSTWDIFSCQSGILSRASHGGFQAVFLQQVLHLLQAQAHTTFNGAERDMPLLCDFGMGIAAEVGQFDNLAVVGRDLIQYCADQAMLLIAPGFLPYVGLFARWVLLIFGLQRYPLLAAMTRFADFVDGAMMHDCLEPAAHVPILCLVGGGFAPGRKKSLLHDIFGDGRILDDAIGE